MLDEPIDIPTSGRLLGAGVGVDISPSRSGDPYRGLAGDASGGEEAGGNVFNATAGYAGGNIGVEGQDKPNAGAIAFLLVAIFVFLAALYCFLRQLSRGRKKEEPKEEPEKEPAEEDVPSDESDDTSSTDSSQQIMDHVEVGISEDNFESERAFVGAEYGDLAKHHSTLDVHHCNSWLCKACLQNNITFVSTVPETLRQSIEAMRTSSFASSIGGGSHATERKDGLGTVSEEAVAEHVEPPSLVVGQNPSREDSHDGSEEDVSGASGQIAAPVDLSLGESASHAGGTGGSLGVDERKTSDVGVRELDISVSVTQSHDNLDNLVEV